MKQLNLLNVSCIVPRVFLGDPRRNAEEIIKCLKKDRTDTVFVFPELSLTGYTCGDLFFQKQLLDESLNALEEIVLFSRSSTDLIVVGLPISINGRLYNVAALIQDGKILGMVPKIYIPENQEYYEKRWFYSGENLDTTIELFGQQVKVSPYLIFEDTQNKEIKIGVEICEDLWAPLPPSTTLAKMGALIILNPSASSETILKSDYREALISQQSARLDCGYCYVSSGYGESTQDLVFGGEAIIAERGVILAQSDRFKTKSSAIHAQIDIDILLHNRRLQSSFRDSFKAEDKEKIIPVVLSLSNILTRKYPKNPFVPSSSSEQEKRFEEILDIQAMGLGSRLKSIGENVKMVIGLSGGLDSTLALLVADKTCEMFKIPKDNILAVTMPGFGTSERTHNNAEELAHEIGAQFREIPIKKSVKLHLKDIGHDLDLKDSTYENSQARERTQILMDLANQEGGIVVGTGDLSELALGWCTYNGDHMAMYGVNAGVPKTLVKYLVDFYASQKGGKLKEILDDILNTPISPELLPPDKEGKIAQLTEETIGPYELHDFFLFHLMRNGFPPEKIYELAKDVFKDDFSEEEILKWLKVFYKRFFSQQYKRSTLPDGPKVGTVSLSPRGDWRMPSDMSGQAFLKSLDDL